MLFRSWLPKARKVYDLDENSERIRLPSGNWKCHKENTVDWNDQKYAEVWRHSWETITNRYLEAAGRPERQQNVGVWVAIALVMASESQKSVRP